MYFTSDIGFVLLNLFFVLDQFFVWIEHIRFYPNYFRQKNKKTSKLISRSYNEDSFLFLKSLKNIKNQKSLHFLCPFLWIIALYHLSLKIQTSLKLFRQFPFVLIECHSHLSVLLFWMFKCCVFFVLNCVWTIFHKFKTRILQNNDQNFQNPAPMN